MVAVMLAAGGCSGTGSAASAEHRADTVLIQNLWRDFSDAWSQGSISGYTFVAAHSHPVLDCDPTDFEDYRLRLPASLQWGVDVNEATIERDDTWPIANLGVPEGRVYVHQNTVTFSGEFPEESRFEESHTAILDGGAVFFFPCR